MMGVKRAARWPQESRMRGEDLFSVRSSWRYFSCDLKDEMLI